MARVVTEHRAPSPVLKPAERAGLPDVKVFMTGARRAVQPQTARRFCKSVVAAVLDGEFIDEDDGAEKEFTAIGVAAAVDAIARGTIDLSPGGDPVAAVRAIYADVTNTSPEPNAVTDVMREAW